jgi:(+)-trans-carveol dehydrogenase
MGKFEGQVVFITGVARGQGRSHAETFAREGAHIVGLDAARKIATTGYPGATLDDVEHTEKLIDALGTESLLRVGDVRDQDAIDQLVADAMDRFGRIDIVLPQAGITSLGSFWELPNEVWEEMIDINLTGVYRALRPTIPHMIAGGRGGSIVMTGSIAGLIGMPGLARYAATKHGVNGLVKSLANELASYNIRVNSVNPTNVGTPMILNENTWQHFRPDLNGKATLDDAKPAFSSYHLLDVPWVEVEDISNAVRWLCSDEARYVTGVALPIDTGCTVKWPGA